MRTGICAARLNRVRVALVAMVVGAEKSPNSSSLNLELFDLLDHLAQKRVRDVFHFLAGVAFLL